MGLLVDDFKRINGVAAQGKVLLGTTRYIGHPQLVAGKSSQHSGGIPVPAPPKGLAKSRLVTRHASSDFVSKYYEVVRDLGRGSFSKVQLVRERRTGQERVCKVVETQDMSAEVLQLTRAEIKVLALLDHPNVVKLYEYADDPIRQRLVLILEYVAGGDCSGLLAATEAPLSETRVARLVYQLLVAVNSCHAVGVVHRDIKPQNLMLSRALGPWGCPELKLIDFGLAAQMVSSRDFVGTPAYMPQEVLIGDVDYTAQADMWSIGCTIVEMLTGEAPFGKPEDFDGDMEPVFEAIRKYKSFREIEGNLEELPGWSERSDEARDFVRRLIRVDPARRLTATQALNHPWIVRHAPPRMSLSAELVKSMSDFSMLPLFFRCCLFVVAARLGTCEPARSGIAFSSADTDSSGLISMEELIDAFHSASVCGWSSAELDATAIFEACDLNHDEQLSYTEFAAACAAPRAVGRSIERLAELSFEVLDSDRDGRVWCSELRGVFPGSVHDALHRLPQDRPCQLEDWCACLKATATSAGFWPTGGSCGMKSAWQETLETAGGSSQNLLMRFLKSLMCEQMLCDSCDQYREDEEAAIGDAPVVLCHNYDPGVELPVLEYKVPEVPPRFTGAGDFEVVRSFPEHRRR
mmetsp:Transcript_15257/g.32941  ORF Transcript_15257/g.32941 Transcript_15257/m.32941 type:complete len:635 (-) Transcript_15257:282-2186(-)|eukprot:CAMPEP_0206437774 /NCGR_PEP_ID=MMETSP0324_2-20121206/11230_1 /ASSEMBLY_ACC=CAM_ASM_000836 /TAXON_ID=2866 /ORGANISM="Crypthecodinium cohnii, Strain Seligo" /LENGTH=634 /DNA_ID=CAMNT_0053905097 /DNA_START=152 /DNA_END=2056 /DNA_ORIENTATION=-